MVMSPHRTPGTHKPRFNPRRARIGLGIAIIAIGLAACQPAVPDTATPTVAATAEPTVAPPPVIVKINLGRAPATIDPLFVGPLDATENDLVENLFAGLARLDGDTGKVEPLLAKSWETASDGLTWRVTLRDDIFWVRINPDTSQMETVRPITAADVVNTVRRACRASAAQAPMLRAVFLIKGCGEINQTDPATLTPAMVEQAVGARVLNDVTVEFALTKQAAYFPTVLAMPVLRPLPAELIDKDGDGWTQPGKVWTSGPYTLQPGLAPAQGYTLIANPFWPIQRAGNVDGVQIAFGDADKAYAAWQAGDLALAAIPTDELARAPFETDARYRMLALPGAAALVASYETPPMDNADVRRALSLGLDRQGLATRVLLPSGEPSIPAFEFAPPGSAGAPGYATAGIGYDPDAAKAALAKAGYSGCRGLPKTVIQVDDAPLSKALGDEIVRQWTETLGCPDGVFAVEPIAFKPLMALLSQPLDARGPGRAGLILLYWQGDYPDTVHWLADIVGCRKQFPDAFLNQSRPCGELDQQIAQAAQAGDEAERAALYKQIEAGLFGADGEMPLIPVYAYTRAVAVASWVAIAPVRAGPLRFDAWVVDTGQQP